MKYLFPVLLLFSILMNTHAQETILLDAGCELDHDTKNQRFTVREPAPEVIDFVSNIVEAAGLAQNFILKAANCNKVLAGISENQRYILYNPDFYTQMINKEPEIWAELGVWVHAIGHHLNNHDFAGEDESLRPYQEIKADRFTGFLLFRLGAYEEERTQYLDLAKHDYENFLYPSIAARKEAVTVAWYEARDKDHPQSSGPDNGNPQSNDKSTGNGRANETRYSPSMINFLNARFPFPPPECHTSYEIPKSEFSDCYTLGDVATKIETAFKGKKYPYKFMSVPDGMAIVAQMEQYNADGTLLDNENRWQDIPKSEASLWSIDYFKNLIFPNKCFLRVFVFLVVNQNWSSDKDKRISKEAAEAWYSEGVNRLPKEIIEKPFTADYGVSLLLYEFEVPEANHSPAQNCPCKFQAIEHFERAGLKKTLSAAKITNPNNFLIEQIKGTWQGSWYTENGAMVLNRVSLQNDQTLLTETYLNGILSGQTTGTWNISNGYFTEMSLAGIYYKYQIEFHNQNAFTLTFAETNGQPTVPIGTKFSYTRM